MRLEVRNWDMQHSANSYILRLSNGNLNHCMYLLWYSFLESFSITKGWSRISRGEESDLTRRIIAASLAPNLSNIPRARSRAATAELCEQLYLYGVYR